jgi:uncharacterized membrane protein YdbT with pleckstrin-like domain
MAEDSRQYIPFLKTLDLASGLTEEQLEKVASRFTLRTLQEGEPLFEGRAPEDDFYIIRSGKIILRYGLPGSERRILTRGQHFSEEDLLYGQPETAVITTDQQTELLHLEENAFFEMLAEFPKVKSGLARTREARQIVRAQAFDWLGEDEVIFYLARKHEALLIYSLLGPFGIFGLALAVISWTASTLGPASLWPAGVAVSAGLALIAVLWGVWNFIDWGNDYYIVTNRRAVWVEKVIFLYDSRDEAPLNYILAVNTHSPFIGRLLHFGSVVIRTYTSEITFRYLPEPGRMAAILEEYRQRLLRGSERIEKRRIDQAMRQRLWQARAAAQTEGTAEGAPRPPASLGGFRRLLSSFFAMRFEQGNVITYRKYWPTLLGKVWIPSLFALLVVAFLGYQLNGFRLARVSLEWLEISFLVGFTVILVVFAPWWVYQYVDWRNDIYQLTDKYVFDIERRPLGTEVKKSGPLENILSMEHERKGFLGYILNYGFVTINVGGAQFVFREVHDPARVQQDIFDRMYALRHQKEQDEAAKERHRLVDVIEIYHNNAEQFRQDDLLDDYDQDFGVELGSDGYP